MAGTELAEARDSEVVRQRLLTAVQELPGELVLGPVAADITHDRERRRAEGQRQALTALNSERYLALQDSCDELLANPPLTMRAHRPAERVLSMTLVPVWRRLRERKRSVAAQAADDELDTALHETRKMVKRLRYAAEVTEPVRGKKITTLERKDKAAHKVRGEHRDAVVARPEIRQLASGMHADGRNGFTFGLLDAAEAERASGAENHFPAAWRKLANAPRDLSRTSAARRDH